MKEEPQKKESELQGFVLQNLLSILENARDGHIMLDTSGNFLWVNKTVEEVSGYSRDELVGKKFYEIGLLTLKSKMIATEKFLGHMAGQKPLPFEIEGLTREGDKIFYEVNSSEIVRDGKIVGDYVVLRDLTERIKLEGEIKKSGQKLRELLLSSIQVLRYNSISLKATLFELQPRINPADADKLKKAIREIEEINQAVTHMRDKSVQAHEM